MAEKAEYTAEELARMEQLRREIAAEESSSSLQRLPSEAEEGRKRLLIAAGKVGATIVSEAGGAAIGQKAGVPLAPYTFGMSVPIGGAIGGLVGYETATRSLGEDPTMLGRLRAAGMGAIPFAPEARLATAAVGEVIPRVTGRELVESAGRMGAANVAATVGSQMAAGEPVSAQDVGISFLAGAGSGGLGRFAGATRASSPVVGRPGAGPSVAVGPSKEAAAAAIEEAQNITRDAQLRNWQAAGGVLDPRQFNPGVVTRAMEKAIGEPQITLEELRRINLAKVGEVARREVGLPVNAELTTDVFAARRKKLGEAYEAVRDVSTTASKTLDKLQASRDEMRRAWRQWKSAKDANLGTTPKLLEDAQEATQMVDTLENRLEAIVKKSGKESLYEALTAARPQLSKLYVVESAVERGPNVVDPSVLGQMHNWRPDYLTDGLRMIAEVYNTQKNAMGTQIVREMARERRLTVPAILRVPAGAALGGQFGGTPGAIAGGIVGGLMGQTATDVASDVMRRTFLPFMTGTGGMFGPFATHFQNVYGMPQYATNVPSNLSLFLAKSGGPAGAQMQQFLNQQQSAPSR